MWRGPLAYGQATADRTLLMAGILGAGRPVRRRRAAQRDRPANAASCSYGPTSATGVLLGPERRTAVLCGEVLPEERQPPLGDLDIELTCVEPQRPGEVPRVRGELRGLPVGADRGLGLALLVPEMDQVVGGRSEPPRPALGHLGLTLTSRVARRASSWRSCRGRRRGGPGADRRSTPCRAWAGRGRPCSPRAIDVAGLVQGARQHAYRVSFVWSPIHPRTPARGVGSAGWSGEVELAPCGCA